MTKFEQDIEAMFNAAANASEDSGEGDVGGDNKKPAQEKVNKTAEINKMNKKDENIVEKTKVEPKEDFKNEFKQETKPEIKKEVEQKTPVNQETSRGKEEGDSFIKERKPLINNQTGSASSEFVSEGSIGRILEMNSTFNKFNDTEKEFVSGYFQIDSKKEKENTVTKVIFGALTANQGDLNALNKIVEAKALDPAERAFFLMDQESNIIENVFEQVELLTGELGDVPNVTNINKLNICRKVEAVIAKMPKDVFAYIEKLQLFADKALDK